MFSAFTPFIRALVRHTEPAHAGLSIRREEKEQGRKSNGHEDEADPSDFWEDKADVSIATLKTFLTEILRAALHRGEEDTSISGASDHPVPAYNPDNPSARAARAYASHATRTPPETAMHVDDENPLASLGAEDLRAIHTLIADLEMLESRGIDRLQIEQAETFLQSLVNAAQKAMDQPSPSL